MPLDLITVLLVCVQSGWRLPKLFDLDQGCEAVIRVAAEQVPIYLCVPLHIIMLTYAILLLSLLMFGPIMSTHRC